MITSIRDITDVTLRSLLYGDDTLSEEQNISVFEAVHRYIYATKRFEN